MPLLILFIAGSQTALAVKAVTNPLPLRIIIVSSPASNAFFPRMVLDFV